MTVNQTLTSQYANGCDSTVTDADLEKYKKKTFLPNTNEKFQPKLKKTEQCSSKMCFDAFVLCMISNI